MRECAAAPFPSACATSCDARWLPHDLLRLRRLDSCAEEPAWVRDAFERAPYGVVRRALAAEGFVSIGVRGPQRAQRYGTWVHADDIVSAVSPESLAHTQPDAGREALPSFVALISLQRDPSGPLAGFVWGPTGSSGFELATRMPTVSQSSDLDLLIRVPDRLALNVASALLAQLRTLSARAGVRIDAQLDTPAGGVALAEWAAGKAHVLARHAGGPRLIADPWAAAAQDGTT
ncbi:malonate decarboxylase holo-ACP synthase [Paraburkholderia sp. UYCP14C]|uniref:malonate decarboxylase holo-ACP synthase n=1 Tax=Paraburkholderia sp. UYCP14C TaxID=2511130 RepID=UPI001022694B|nr:malonate decarboxylase holo-ACP synthase [Paraburkholderia sp. UYCP14C]RZF27081.1 malonate decarboxylase holo-ACP synthase [Paraburkholderia sp. UYCP14C]